MAMLRFHSSRLVSSSGAELAMPAFDTRISSPPYSTASRSQARVTEPRRVTSQITPRTASAPCASASCRVMSSSAAWSMSASMTQAPSPSSRRAVALPMPPAPPVTSATRPGEALRRRHALQLRLLEQPVLDVEGLLFGQRHVAVDALGLAHHVDRVDIELGGDACGGLVACEAEHADAGHEVDHRIGIAHRRAVGPRQRR
jgi:hypothetical protein